MRKPTSTTLLPHDFRIPNPADQNPASARWIDKPWSLNSRPMEIAHGLFTAILVTHTRQNWII